MSGCSNEDFEFCLKNFPSILIKLLLSPKYLFLTISSFFSYLAELFDFSYIGWIDFSEDIDWVYLLLFITASIPWIGIIPDFIIIINALIDGKYFLAIVNSLTFLVSTILTLHIVDLGAIFKIFYYFDVQSYNNQLQILQDKNDKLVLVIILIKKLHSEMLI